MIQAWRTPLEGATDLWTSWFRILCITIPSTWFSDGTRESLLADRTNTWGERMSRYVN